MTKDNTDSDGQDVDRSGEIEQLVELFLGMAVDKTQALTMASQLSKRVTQLTSERGITREDAMEHILKITLNGWKCQVPEEHKPDEKDG